MKLLSSSVLPFMKDLKSIEDSSILSRRPSIASTDVPLHIELNFHSIGLSPALFLCLYLLILFEKIENVMFHQIFLKKCIFIDIKGKNGFFNGFRIDIKERGCVKFKSCHIIIIY
ncbi:hypothetical protein TNIN_357341 [Trichonephila inaurata madagascariensis]|uniref:Uncharacterized protein n=1 Tax=Trichonephila inaurata madagascariensis TaxID=2747483 RepID=A0A8X6X2J3_9ARAC|nr:hypothetical protein TNIN_357341 [Trichonephila inaurata madagascariensis]